MALSGESVQNGVFNLSSEAAKFASKLKPVAEKPLHFSIEGEDRALEYVRSRAIRYSKPLCNEKSTIYNSI